MLTTLDAGTAFVFDPRGRVDADDMPVAPARHAGRVAARHPHNSKWNANKLLRGAQASLERTS